MLQPSLHGQHAREAWNPNHATARRLKLENSFTGSKIWSVGGDTDMSAIPAPSQIELSPAVKAILEIP
jgi:hypothetical protein